jgi:TRAP-type C4-dicarboxylate transport system permease small subunit
MLTDNVLVDTIDAVARRINDLVEIIVGINMIVLTAVVFLQIFFRYVLRSPLSWSDETARFLFLSVVFLGLSPAYRKGDHLGFTVIHEKIPKKWVRRLLNFIHFLVIILMVIMVFYGLDAIKIASRQISPSLQISMSIPYAFIPIGSILVIIQIGSIFANAFRK